MKPKTAILIDGSNFYFKMKSLGFSDLLRIDFTKLALFLAPDDTVLMQKFYIGAVKTDGSKKVNRLHNEQQKLFAHLKMHKFAYELGYLLKSNGKFHEKGVDVHLAVDLLSNSYENNVDKFILISSDTDLIPAINKTIQIGKVVEYVGFSHQPSVALVAKCTTSRLLTLSEISQFVS